MRVIVFGATGTIGRHLCRRALFDGHTVTAFARRPEALDIRHKNLRLHAGNALNPDDVHAAVDGHDAVIVVLGAGAKGAVRAEGTRNIIAAMKQHGIKRLICESTLGAGDSVANLNFFWRYVMFGLLLRAAFQDHLKQEDYVRQSGLEWTIVRPAAFVDEPEASTFKHGFAPDEKGLTLSIARSDVAKFMAEQLTSSRYLYKTPGLSY